MLVIVSDENLFIIERTNWEYNVSFILIEKVVISVDRKGIEIYAKNCLENLKNYVKNILQHVDVYKFCCKYVENSRN